MSSPERTLWVDYCNRNSLDNCWETRTISLSTVEENSMSIDRSPEMIKLAYFMAKYGNTVGDKVKPPSEMGVKTWVEAYRRLFKKLGDGRSFKTFQGSINQDRRHYIECLAGDKTDTEDRREILGAFLRTNRAGQWTQISSFMS